MPNWVYNSLVVSGDKSELERMVAKLNEPVTRYFPKREFDKEQQKWIDIPDTQHYSNPVFSFQNIVAPTDLEAYYGEEVFKKINLDNGEFMQEFIRSMSEDNDWYHWNCRNWGTKWDIAVADDEQYSDTRMEWTDNGDVMYHFQTAWSPVGEVLMKLSEQFPTLSFDYEYEEEQGWGGKCTFENGDDVSCEEWDIPTSHADYVNRDRECNCEEGTYPDYAYEDCPVDTNAYEWDSENWEWVEKVSDPSAMMETSK